MVIMCYECIFNLDNGNICTAVEVSVSSPASAFVTHVVEHCCLPMPLEDAMETLEVFRKFHRSISYYHKYNYNLIIQYRLCNIGYT